MALAFDTLKLVDRLESGGFSEKQARTITEAQRDILIETIDINLATKSDIMRVEAKIAAVDNKLDKVETELKANIDKVETELKADILAVHNKIDKVETELKASIDKVETELKADILAVNHKIDKVETELKADILAVNHKIDKVETELKADIAQVKSSVDQLAIQFVGKFNLLNWMFGFILAFVVALSVKLFL